ncbi:MAG: hypothetical protein WBF34_31015 [Streptosporangiaceae bacterium]
MAKLQDESFTGEGLEKALVNDELSQPGLELLGMVKASDQKDHVSFTGSGCDDWIDIPTKMIEKAERVASSKCKDHSHPVFKLILKESTSAEVQVLSALLAQRASGEHAVAIIDDRPAVGPFPIQSPQSAGFPQMASRGPRGGFPGGGFTWAPLALGIGLPGMAASIVWDGGIVSSWLAT